MTSKEVGTMGDDDQHVRVCGQHSGFRADIKHLQESDLGQWKHINAMRSRSIVTLTAVCMNLLGIIVSLIILFSTKGVHP